MVSSGSVNGNNVDGTEGSYLNWQVASQDVDGNFSTLNWQVGWRFSTTSCRGLRLGRAVINGTVVYDDHDSGDGVHAFVSGHNHKPRLQTASGSINVGHNADGTKEFSASVKMTGFSGLLSQGSSIWTLPEISQVPDPPSSPVLSNIHQTSLTAMFDPNDSGGTPIIGYEVGYSTVSDVGGATVVAGYPPVMITGLLPATKYYFWARAENSNGWSDWSTPGIATTLAGARVNVANVYKQAIPYVRSGGVWKLARPYGKIAGVWKEGI